MFHYYLVFFNLVIILTFLHEHVSALEIDGIIGGTQVHSQSFPYQVAILGMQNYSFNMILVCGGSIVTNYFILSAGKCFINQRVELKKLRFSVRAGSIDLESYGIDIEVKFIYTFDENSVLFVHDIALLQLEDSLSLESSTNLDRLMLPSINQSFKGEEGVIAGYGAYQIESTINRMSGIEIRGKGYLNFKLNYLTVKVLNSSQCKKNYPEVDPLKQICGVTLPESPILRSGICTGDYGSLLVIDNVAVGIASRNRANCDDTFYGCVYTRVSAFIPFIQRILFGLPLVRITKQLNPIYIKPIQPKHQHE